MLLQWVQTGKSAWFKLVTLKEIPSCTNLFAEILHKSKSQRFIYKPGNEIYS